MSDSRQGSRFRTYTEIVELVETLGKGVVEQHASDVDDKARFPVEAFAAFKEARLLSAMVPQSLGGDGLNIKQLCKLCEILGQYCASTTMVYAMHQIQVACLVNHALTSSYFQQYLADLVEHQYLLASATTELGIGGDLRSSICGLELEGDNFKLVKQAPVISYALNADAILVTCRANTDAAASDQVHVLVKTKECEFEQIAGWDTLGFRGTCSSGYTLTAAGHVEQVIPAPFATILSKSMHPVSHVLWGSLWTGLAASAVKKARQAVRHAYRKNPDMPPVTSLRLSEVDELLFSMRGGLYQSIEEYQGLLDGDCDDAFTNFGFSIRTNNVKLRCSEMVVDIVGKALMIVGIMGYKNDSPVSLSRHIRDAYGAALMVNNDRIRGHNATMQIAMRDS